MSWAGLSPILNRHPLEDLTSDHRVALATFGGHSTVISAVAERITDLCAPRYSWLLAPTLSGISFKPTLAKASSKSAAVISS